MEEFVWELERVIKTWPETSKWTIAQLAMYTRCDADDIAKWSGAVFKKSMGHTDGLSIEEGESLLSELQQVLKDGSRLGSLQTATQNQATDLWQKFKEKNASLLADKNWPQSYKNINYFIGQNNNKLDFETKLEVLGECLRLGRKANVPPKELTRFLRTGIQDCIHEGSQESIEEALDFLDAYGSMFSDSDCMPTLEDLVEVLLPSIGKFGLEERIREVRSEWQAS